MADYSEVIPTRPGFYVYRLWAADGSALYVGLTGERGPRRVRVRLKQHQQRKPWFTQVARIDVAAFTCALEIIAEEASQIAQLQPVHNKVLLSNLDPVLREKAYAREYSRRPKELERQRERITSGKRAAYRQRPEVRERERQRSRTRMSGWKRDAMRLRKPGTGQGGLWR